MHVYTGKKAYNTTVTLPLHSWSWSAFFHLSSNLISLLLMRHQCISTRAPEKLWLKAFGFLSASFSYKSVHSWMAARASSMSSISNLSRDKAHNEWARSQSKASGFRSASILHSCTPSSRRSSASLCSTQVTKIGCATRLRVQVWRRLSFLS